MTITRKEFEAKVKKRYLDTKSDGSFIDLAIACAAEAAAEHGLQFAPELPARLSFVPYAVALAGSKKPVIMAAGKDETVFLTPDQARAVCDLWAAWGPEGALRREAASYLDGWWTGSKQHTQLFYLLAEPWAVKP
jgi:hypothetical protein